MKAFASRWTSLACALVLASCARSREQVPAEPDVAGTGSSAGTSAMGARAGTAGSTASPMPVVDAPTPGAAGSGGPAPGRMPSGGAGAGGQGGANEPADATAGSAAPESLPPAPSCDLQLGSCPARQGYDAWGVLLDAARFGDDARFVALGQRAVLVAAADPAFRVALFVADAVDGVEAVWSFPEGDLEGLDVVSGSNEVFALACDSASAGCTVLRGDDSSPTLAELPGGTLPADFEPRGIVFDEVRVPQVVCVYGNGLLCHQQGAWVEAIAVAADLQLDDVVIEGDRALAVGSHGRYFQRLWAATDEPGPWVEQLPLADVELTSAMVAGSGAVIVGEGRVQAALGDLHDELGCGTPEDLVAFVTEGMAVTHDGTVLYHAAYTTTPSGTQTFLPAEPGEFCEHQQLMIGDILDTSTAPCGLSTNPRVLSETQVVGMDICPVG